MVFLKLWISSTQVLFQSAIGYIMDGRGLKELLSTVYALGSHHDKILDGHAFPRGHILVHCALGQLIFK